jgi:hypothetical protein
MSSIDLQLPPMHPPASNFVRWICTSNPFYVISAGLFLFGLRISFVRPNDDTDTWALMIGLAGYTVLLATAALIWFVSRVYGTMFAPSCSWSC